MWENHLRLCTILLLLIIPIAIFDFAMLKGKSGDWISLDFRGIITGIYVIVVVVHIALSSAMIRFSLSQNLWSVHGISALLAIVLFSVCTYGYDKWRRNREHREYEMVRASRAKLFDVLTLNNWSYSPESSNAKEIIISVTIRESGRFTCNASGYGEGEYGEMCFYGDRVMQRKVEKGENFMHTIPLKWIKPVSPARVEITLYLFADRTGSAGVDITKIFTTQPDIEDDGHFFYGVLPSPKPGK